MKVLRTGLFQYLLSMLVLGIVTLAPVRSVAQQGDKTVYTTNDSLTPSTSWIDASAFCSVTGSGGTNSCVVSSTFDFCAVLSSALHSLLTVSSPAGGVVDARGVLSVPPRSAYPTELCQSNPFSQVSQTNTHPITILLPPFTVEITSLAGSWTLPNNVKLVGVGLSTVLEGDSGCCSPALIEMGPPPTSGSCTSTYTGIGIEHLQIITKGSFGGIDNECAGASSYVRDVKISGLTNTVSLGGDALTIGAGAANSGPYTDIYVQVAPGQNTCGSGTGYKCVNINAQTRGLHGITCQGGEQNASPNQVAAIVVNGSNNSIEDVHVESWYDAIQIGSTAAGVSNVFVSNVEASTNSCGAVKNTVHLCGSQNGDNPACPSYGPLTDVSIMGVSNGPVQSQQPVVSIQDDATGTTIEGCQGPICPAPITTGMYFLGRPLGSTGEYSRFAINPATSNFYGNATTVVPTWGADTGSISGSQCYTPGAIYSNTTMGGGQVYVCTFPQGSGSTTEWVALP